MLASGDWLLPTLDGEHPHLTKPPMTYWALASSFGLLGTNEWAARLPGALAFVGTGLLVADSIQGWVDEFERHRRELGSPTPASGGDQ